MNEEIREKAEDAFEEWCEENPHEYGYGASFVDGFEAGWEEAVKFIKEGGKIL